MIKKYLDAPYLVAFLSFDIGDVFGVIDNVLGTDLTGQKAASDRALKNSQKLADAERKWNAEQAAINRDFQTSERLAAQQYQSDEWNRRFDVQALYESPAKQVERIKAAGLNPNALYQGANDDSVNVSGASSAGSSGSAASYSSGIPAASLQYDLNKSLVQSQIQNTNAQTANMLFDLGFKRKNEDVNSKQLGAQLNKTRAERDKIIHEIKWGDVSSDIEKGMYNWYSALSAEDIKLKKEQLNLLRNQSLELLSRVKVNEKSISVMDTQIDVNKSQEMLNYANVSNADADTLKKYSENNLLITQEEKLSLEKQLVALEKDFSSAIGAPIGTPLYNLQFKLWKDGKLWDYCGTLAPDASKTALDVVGHKLKEPSKISKIFDIGASLLGRGLLK